MRDLIARPPARIEPSLTVRATICLEIAQSFLELHASGFCYQDVNFGNIFFKPDTGAVLICDNDNVDVDGVPASVYGTRKFMAPEIVRREAMPSTRSDLFSMAVLFFYVLHAWHPLDGKAEAAIDIMDSTAEMGLYGEHPVFLFDPVDTSNSPLKGMHEPVAARWNALPQSVRSLFLRSFTTGLRQPGARVQEAEWSAAFSALATSGFACHDCEFEHTVELRPAGREVVTPPNCFGCGRPLAQPPVLVVGRSAICLTPGHRVPLQLLAPESKAARSQFGAVVERHPTKPEIIGLRNAGARAWQVQLPDGGTATVPPGNTMRVLNGAVIQFGSVSGQVTA
jgi:serine/threonine protein kinase